MTKTGLVMRDFVIKRRISCSGLSPPMRVANKLTPEPKSKMAEIMPEHTGREQKELKRCLSLLMRVADKPTPEPILRCFYNQGKSQMLATS